MTNKRGALTLAVEPADLLWLARCLRREQTVAHMCHAGESTVSRIERMFEQVRDALPEVARCFDTYKWADMVLAVEAGEPYDVSLEHAGYPWHDERELVVRVGATSYKADRSIDEAGRFRAGDPRVEELKDLLDQFAPIHGASPAP